MAENEQAMDDTSDLTPEADKVSLREKIGLGFGKAVVDGTHGTLHVLVSQVYNMTMGLNPIAISTVVLIQRLWDAMLDPFFGQYSDNLRTRWGRRIPMIFVGAFPLAILFAAMWWFPTHVNWWVLFAFLLLATLAFYAAHSLFAMPLGGLIVEATSDYHERTKIAGVTLAFGFAVQIGSNWVFPLAKMKFWGGTINGIRWVSIGCAILFLIAGLMPVLLCRERQYKKVAIKQKRVGFRAGLKAASGNKSFMRLLWARGLFSFGFNVVGQLGSYMYYYAVFKGDTTNGAVYYSFIGSSYHVAAILTSMFVFPVMERAYGKKRTLQLAASVMFLGCIAKFFFFQPGWKWLPMIVTITNGIANAGVALMSASMLGDLSDQDEWETGSRREGLFSALLSWFDKAGNSVGSFLTGFILVFVGFYRSPDLPPDAVVPQSAHTMLWMKYCYIIAPAFGAAATILFIWQYSLTQKQVMEIKDELARRRAGQATEEALPTEPR